MVPRDSSVRCRFLNLVVKIPNCRQLVRLLRHPSPNFKTTVLVSVNPNQLTSNPTNCCVSLYDIPLYIYKHEAGV